MAGDRCAGFGHQKVKALIDAQVARADAGPRLYTSNADPRFQRLRRLLEDEWTPQLISLLEIPRRDLPMIWDADFMLGLPGAQGRGLRAWRDQRQLGVPDSGRGAGGDRPSSCRSAAVEALNGSGAHSRRCALRRN
jgi:hypothetical protein